MTKLVAWAVLLPALVLLSATPRHDSEPVLLEDFESYDNGSIPEGWQEIRKRSLVMLRRHLPNENAQLLVRREGSNQFLRMSTKGGVGRIVRTLQESPQWDLATHPVLQWRWKARKLPRGASEADLNDVAASVYVTFSLNVLRIPKSIKYTYSSTLPVGTIVDFRRLKVLVVASGQDGLNQWRLESRDVRADYRRLFGEEPPQYPLAVTLSSDSDTTEDASEADFDDLRFVTAR